MRPCLWQAKPMTDRADLVDIKKKALETAYRLDAYSMYGGTKAGALRALKRRCPGWQKEELAPWLDKAIDVQEAASAWLRDNEDVAWAWYRRDEDEEIVSVAGSFTAAHPDWPESALGSLLGINFLYFYLM